MGDVVVFFFGWLIGGEVDGYFFCVGDGVVVVLYFGFLYWCGCCVGCIGFDVDFVVEYVGVWFDVCGVCYWFFVFVVFG